MQVRTVVRTLARAPVTEDPARRATQQEMTVREGRAHDERNPHQGIDEAGERGRFSSAVRSPASFVLAGQWIAKPT